MSGTQWLTTDHLGSTRLVTDQSGNVAKTFDYLPFGEEIGGTSSTGPTQRFTGQERDTESGLDNFKARYVSAPQGRFQSPDPLGMFVADPSNPQSWNLYAYVMNNPLKYKDPTGLAVENPRQTEQFDIFIRPRNQR
jgi:RHS repeat-associated protein